MTCGVQVSLIRCWMTLATAHTCFTLQICLTIPINMPWRSARRNGLYCTPGRRSAGMCEGQIDGEILVKARGLLQYLRRDGPTGETDPAFKRQTNDQLLRGLVLTPKSSDLRRNFHLNCAFEVFALQHGQRERGLCHSIEK